MKEGWNPDLFLVADTGIFSTQSYSRVCKMMIYIDGELKHINEIGI